MNKMYLDYQDIEKNCVTILHQMFMDEWEPDYIVGLTRGGLLPATLLSHFLKKPMYSLDVSLRDNTDFGPESNCWMSEDALDGKNILIVDDINDSGATLKWIINDWKHSNRPASPEWDKVWGHNVRFAVIVNNEASDFRNISYYGFDINKLEKDVWVVFPWEEWFGYKSTL